MNEELETIQNLANTAIDFLVNYSFQVIGAVFILIIGFLVARFLSKMVVDLCEKRDLDVTLSKFIGNLVRIGIFDDFTAVPERNPPNTVQRPPLFQAFTDLHDAELGLAPHNDIQVGTASNRRLVS